jgi:TPR repeat protein
MKAAEQGNIFAQVRLSYAYENGMGVEKDHEKAVEWHTKAAETQWKVYHRLPQT